MHVVAFREVEKNVKTGKREVGEERKQVTNFKEAACCPSAFVQLGSTVCVRE